MDLFKKIDQLVRKPFCDCERAGRFLNCSSRTIRRLVASGEVAGIRRGPRGQWKVLTESVARNLVDSLWSASLDGQPLPIDLDRLEDYARRYSVIPDEADKADAGATDRT